MARVFLVTFAYGHEKAGESSPLGFSFSCIPASPSLTSSLLPSLHHDDVIAEACLRFTILGIAC